MDWLESLNTYLSPFFTGLLVAAGVGLIIGLEREFSTHDKPGHLAGIRTFTLVAITGYCAGWISSLNFPEVLIAVLAGFFLIVALGYYSQAVKGNAGLTTEVALIMTMLLGIVISAGYMRESLAVVVLITMVLSLKEQLHGIIRQITEEELFAFIKFIVLALLILPMLPDEPFGPENLLNLRDIGWIAVLVLSISFTGYLLLKFGSPKKGILLTAFVGGLISSTLVAWTFSARSRERHDLANIFGSGIVLASSIMYVRVFALTMIFARPVAMILFLPLLLMLLVSIIPAWRALKARQVGTDAQQLSPGNPLDVRNAVIFILLYIGVTYLMYSARHWLGMTMAYLSGALAGIADIDAITISTSKWSASESGQDYQAATIILLAAMSNTMFKLGISFFNGAAAMRRPVLTGFGMVLLIGTAFLLYWLFGMPK